MRFLIRLKSFILLMVLACLPAHAILPSIDISSTIAENEVEIGLTPINILGFDLPLTLVGGDDVAAFMLVGNQLRMVTAPDFENPTDTGADNTYELIVGSTVLGIIPQNILITVINVNDNAPVLPAAISAEVDENITAAVYTFVANDIDQLGSLSYAIASGADQFDFNIVNDQLFFSTPPDFDAPSDGNGDNLYNLVVQVSDGLASSTSTVAILVKNTNDEAPIFQSSAALSVVEGTLGNLAIAVSDIDNLGTPVLSIQSGDDAGLFQLVGDTLSFISPPFVNAPSDADSNNVYQLTLAADDGVVSTTQLLSVSVVDDTDGDTVANSIDLDDDNDGFSDADELSVGTDPLDVVDFPADLDGDFIPDTLDPDQDGDNLLDADELANGTSTTSSDTDADGLSDLAEGVFDQDADGVIDALESNQQDADNDGVVDALDSANNDPNNDSDLDGYANQIETQSGTDPLDLLDVPADLDGDGVPDVLDPDTDNDGLSNAVEAVLGTDPTLVDSDGDGQPDGSESAIDSDGDGANDALESNILDSDNDGVVDQLDQVNNDPNNDSDGDGYSNSLESLMATNPLDSSSAPADIDGDGIPDANDSDRDGDGVLNTDEIVNGTNPNIADSDGDGANDGSEGLLDSDGDGVLDVLESSITDQDSDGVTDQNDADNSNPNNDSDGDGISNANETALGFDPLLSSQSPPDLDADSVPDQLDTDRDGDGFSNTVETNLGTNPDNPLSLPADLDGDLIADSQDNDIDGDGLDNTVEAGLGLNPLLVDSDADGVADSIEVGDINNPSDGDGDGVIDALDSQLNDSDSDGVLDQFDAANLDSANDSDGDGVTNFAETLLGTDPLSTDTDGDGLTDNLDLSPLNDQSDSDNDGALDQDEILVGTDPLNPDSDGDGLLDGVEIVFVSQTVVRDTDGDGNSDALDTDDDGDGSSTSDELAQSDQDIDQDGISSHLDAVENGVLNDSDADGVLDTVECTAAPACNDADKDGIPDYMDQDSDDNGIVDGNEFASELDVDGDGLVNRVDVDDDGDGISDSIEVVDVNNPSDDDADGIPNMTDPDGSSVNGINDSDDDGLDDVLEVGSQLPLVLDSDNDLRPDFTDTDSDNDGQGDRIEGTLDTDGDGLLDFRESRMLDSDDDGVVDELDSMNLVATNDSDGDGVGNLLEKLAGSNPLDPNSLPVDSDFDGIPDLTDSSDDVVVTSERGLGMFVTDRASLVLLLTLITLLITGCYRGLFLGSRGIGSSAGMLGFLTLSMFAYSPVNAESKINSTADLSDTFNSRWSLGAGFGISSLNPDYRSQSSFQQDEDRGNAASIAVGFDLNPNWNLTLSYHDLGKSTFIPQGTINYRSMQLNVRYFNWLVGDAHLAGSWAITPSLGYAQLRTSAEDISIESKDISQVALGVGVDYNLTEHWRVRLELMSLAEDAQYISMQAERRFGEAHVPRPRPKLLQTELMPLDSSARSRSSSSAAPKHASSDVENMPPNNSDRSLIQQPRNEPNASNAVAKLEDRVRPDPSMADRCINFSFYPNRIMFDDNSRAVGSAARRTLAELAMELKRFSSVNVVIAAYTDTRGSAAVNQQLSIKRGNQVQKILQRNGVAKKRIRVVGYGEKKPLYSNETEYGRAANRRVELRFTKPDGCPN